MVVLSGKHPAAPRDSEVEAYLISTSQGSRPGDARVPVGQIGAAPRAGWSTTQSASGASTFLRRQEGPPGFPPQPRRKPRPPSSLSMARARPGV